MGIPLLDQVAGWSGRGIGVQGCLVPKPADTEEDTRKATEPLPSRREVRTSTANESRT